MLPKGCQQILVALALFGYLTAEQLTRLYYSAGSLTFVKALLKKLVSLDLVFTIGGRGTGLPLIYTLSSTGRTTASAYLALPQRTRIRPSEVKDTGENLYFMQHTLSVNDVLIGAYLLSHTVPGIQLTRMYREPALKRKIYVEIPERICLEPDASCEFTITETTHETPETWEQFLHIEVYRNLPPQEWRFKQKIQGYVTYDLSGQHAALFATPVLSIAVLAATQEMAATLKRWTEDVLATTNQQEEGDWFYFCSVNPATTSPHELFLSPVWEQAFTDTKAPLLVLE